MSMINPYHECWTSRRHKTEIILDQRKLIGAGVPLRVLMHGLRQEELVWFSRIHGFLADDCLVLGVARPAAQELEKTFDPDMAPIQAVLKGDFEIEEYLLTKPVQSALGVISRQVVVRAGDGTEEYGEQLDDDEIKGVSMRVHVHDDCFFNVQPAEGKILHNLVAAILEQHSFYLGREVDWEPIMDEIKQILAQVPAMELKSDPRRTRLTLTVKSKGVRMSEALFGFRPQYIVDVSSGVARFVYRPARVRACYLKAT